MKIWSDIFEVEPIGINDNFFDLGGSSLSAVRLFAQDQNELRSAAFSGPGLRGTDHRKACRGASESAAATEPIRYCRSAPDRAPFSACLAGRAQASSSSTWPGSWERGRQSSASISKGFFKKPRRSGRSNGRLLDWCTRCEAFSRVVLTILEVIHRVARWPSEMARQLHGLGEPIGLLALIDSYGFNYPRAVSRLAREWEHWRRMRRRLRPRQDSLLRKSTSRKPRPTGDTG